MYATLMRLAAPLLRRHVLQRAQRGKEDPARLDERFGIAGVPRPPGKIVWFHAASVGEAMAILPLVKATLARFPQVTVLLTTHTASSARLLAGRLPERTIHQFLPLDHPLWVERFLAHWKPDAVIWTESEFWPCWLTAIARKAIPAAMVNGRLSARSARQWRLLRQPLARMLEVFMVRLAQSDGDAERLSDFCSGFRCVGNLKTAFDPQPLDEDAARQFRLALSGRPFWLAANTHPGEDEIALEVHKALAADRPGFLTIIVPRHPVRAAGIVALAEAAGLAVAQRSQWAIPGPATEIYLADTMGELRLFYAVSPIAFIGGSFTARIGVHSPIEAVYGNAAIVHGPYTGNNGSLTELLENANAAIRVNDAQELSDTVEHWIDHPDLSRDSADRATVVMQAQGDIVARVMVELQPVFMRAGIT